MKSQAISAILVAILCLAIVACSPGTAVAPTPTPVPALTCDCPATPLNGRCVMPYEKMVLELLGITEKGEDIRLPESFLSSTNAPDQRILPIEQIIKPRKPDEFLFIDLLTYEQLYNKYTNVGLSMSTSRSRMIYVTGRYEPNGASSRGGYDKPVHIDHALVIAYFDAQTGAGLGWGMCAINADKTGCVDSDLLRCP